MRDYEVKLKDLKVLHVLWVERGRGDLRIGTI
jgi:hypothetical protein